MKLLKIEVYSCAWQGLQAR